MAHWLPAHEHQASRHRLYDIVRLSEWPVSYDLDQWSLAAVDQISITLANVQDDVSDKTPPPAFAPSRLWNVLACGAAAPILATMLNQGARIAQAESTDETLLAPFLVICEFHSDKHIMGTSRFMKSFARTEVLAILEDLQTNLAAIAWYDVGGQDTLDYLNTIKHKRRLFRAGCPIVVYKPIPTLEEAIKEFNDLRDGRMGLAISQVQVYNEIRHASITKEDIDPYGYLHQLS